MVRPIVLLFQEFATTSVTPTVPDLNCVVVGPAYQIQDYPDDKAAIAVADYGVLYADNPATPPVAFTAAITLAAAPSLATGAWVDPASVRVYFENAQVVLASGSDGVTVTTAPNENTFASASADFTAAGVQAGDTIIMDVPGNPSAADIRRTVLSVESSTVLRLSTNFTVAATVLKYRIERKIASAQVDSSFVTTPVFMASNQITLLGGVTLIVGGTPRVVTYANVFVEYRAFRTDLQTLDTVASTSEILTKVGRIDARNPLAAALSVARQNAGTVPIQFYGVASNDLVGYNLAKDALSADDSIYAIVPLTTDLAVFAAFKAENETLADPNLALANGVPQKFRTVIGNSVLTERKDIVAEKITGTAEALAASSPPGFRNITITGLTALTSFLRPGDKLTVSASENTASLDGVYTIAHINTETNIEVDEAFPAEVLAAEGINYTITRPSTGATLVPLVDSRGTLTHADVLYTAKQAGVTPATRTIALVDTNDASNAIASIVETPTTTTINADITGGVTAAQIVAGLNAGTGVVAAFSGSLYLTASTATPATVQTALTPTALSGGADVLASATTLDNVYIRLFDGSASFITAGVLPGDIIEIPADPNGVFTTSGTKQFIVNTLVSEQRVEIKNIVSGSYVNNSSIKENELPHTDDRTGTNTQVNTSALRYRIVRELTKTQQITQLVTEAQSLNSRRAVLTWPDVVTVAGLVDGSKPANSDGSAAAADPQPGYYLSAAVGGMTAGLPSHQGFSRLGVAGIGKVTHASDYFSEAQLTDLSNGGWYVFKQNSPTALPYSIHQLTTDPSTLESGEYSVVKNFDFVSLYYLGLLEPFLGVWNVNEDTLNFLRQAVNSGTENLKLRRVPKIGAPLNSANISSLFVSPSSADRIEIFVEVSLPKPLNVIGLHLVA